MNIPIVPNFSDDSVLDCENFDDSFFSCNLGEILSKYEEWQKVFPRIKPYYAVKCNTDATLLKLMVEMGLGFDCAGRGEIELMLELGAKAKNIVYAHPIKPVSHLTYARENLVSRIVFDCKDELDKIHKHHRHAQLFLRILTDDKNSVVKLSKKFGAKMEDCPDLLDYAYQLELNVIGISFHVGSDCREPSSYIEPLQNAKSLFDYAKQIGYKFTFLDIGGGFPGRNSSLKLFENIGNTVNDQLGELFPPEKYPELEVIAEPGRYFATSAYTLYTKVIGKKTKRSTSGNTIYNYIINDGKFNNFYLIRRDISVSSQKNQCKKEDLKISNIWGASLHSDDKVKTSTLLPEFFIDDVIMWKDFGCYRSSISSDYMSHTPSKTKYFLPQKYLYRLVQSKLSVA